MSKINWKVRIKNKTFWVTIIPAVLLLVQQVLRVFGIEFEYTGLSEQLTGIAGTVFVILSIVGVVNDPTTSGISDSTQALTYEAPKKEEKKGE